MRSARDWKTFYRREREELGPEGLQRLLDEAEPFAQPASAMIFPHTRLASSGALVAAAALMVIRSGVHEVLALGVLHGARVSEDERLRRAHEGDQDALVDLRRIHGPGAPLDGGFVEDAFSLDGFIALLDAAAKRERRRAPRVFARYPLFAGASPESLPGFDELARLQDSGAGLVATGDMLHHGPAFGTPDADCLDEASVSKFARGAIVEMVGRLVAGEYAEHERRAVELRSDFRDAGPTFAALLRRWGRPKPQIVDLRVADYADVLGGASPSWVAGALVSFAYHRGSPPSQASNGPSSQRGSYNF